MILGIAATVLLVAAPAFSLGFTVHGYELGERIELMSGRQVWTAQLDVSLESVADHVAAFCVDLDSHIGIGDYDARDVLAASATSSPADEAPRDFAWAGHVMSHFGYDVDQLIDGGVTRVQAITGVQAAIWDGLYGGGIVNADSLSMGARSIFEAILDSEIDAVGSALVIDLVGNQDQVISGPVPEPSAALVFGLGAVVAGGAIRRRQR
ncbi:MAG: hypothetical protein CL908_00075 [Deltaproteobacteria bacterium]|nr:hypothetical protein [Deltaproteobacteria bacterium]